MLFPKIWIICRVCLKQQQQMYNLYDDRVPTKIWLFLRDCGGVPVRKDDDLPDQICDTCLGRLTKAMHFRIDCQRSHRDLVEMLMKKNDIMHEHFLMDSDLKSSNNSVVKVETQMASNQNQINENKAYTTVNENKYIKNENNNCKVKQYCVVPKHYSEETNQDIKNKSQETVPIVLLLRLKDIKDKNNCPTHNETEAETTTTNGLKKYKKVPKQRSNKTIKGVEEYSKLIKEKYKPDLKIKQIKFSCKVCKKVFKSKELLRHHMYAHQKPYQCKICYEKFTQKHVLISHNNKHCGVSPHSCRICYQTYANVSTRNRHERIQHKNLEFKCEKCNKVFRFLALLHRHAQSHRPKKCFICNKEFASLQMVRKHHQRKHLKLL